jgi:aminoglycoside phosphotransferase (APT) family kinase protein
VSSGLGRPPAEVEIDAGLVRRLLAAQFPRWAGLPVREVPGAGWDNVIYRLGADLAVRLPRRLIGAEQVGKQHRWLPALAGRLPLAIPVLAGRGVPGEGYPWRWSVTSWLPGEIAAQGRGVDLPTAAARLAGFIAALRAVDLAGEPVSEFRRDLASRDRPVADAIGALGDVPHREAVLRAWRRARAAPAWDGPPVWMHGDLHPANLLITDGQLSGVIDFGLLGAGDPAVDLMVAWTFLSAPARQAFRAALPADDATWERGRGWALDLGLRCAAYSADNPLLGEIGRYTVGQVLTELHDDCTRPPAEAAGQWQRLPPGTGC